MAQFRRFLALLLHFDTQHLQLRTSCCIFFSRLTPLPQLLHSWQVCCILIQLLQPPSCCCDHDPVVEYLWEVMQLKSSCILDQVTFHQVSQSPDLLLL